MVCLIWILVLNLYLAPIDQLLTHSLAAKPKFFEVFPIAIYILSVIVYKALLFLSNSTYIIIHNHLQA